MGITWESHGDHMGSHACHTYTTRVFVDLFGDCVLLVSECTAIFFCVQREARAHFNCQSLPGLELENQGGTATAGSHWEKRITEVCVCVCVFVCVLCV